MTPNAIWRLPAVCVTNLSNTGNRREPLYAAGYRRMDILIAEGSRIHDVNVSELKAIGPTLINQGWTLTTWHSTTGGTSPAVEADTAIEGIKLVKDFIRGHILNAESWYEGSERWRTAAYWDRFCSLSTLPVAVLPLGSDTGSSRRDFDYDACLARGCMIYPQQYQNEHATLTIPAGDANLAFTGIPLENRGTSPGCYINDVALSIPWDQYAADLKVINRPVLLYAADLNGFDPAQAAKLIVPNSGEDEDEVKIGYQDGIDAWFDWLLKNAAWQQKFSTWLAGPRTTTPPKPPAIPTRGPNYDPNDLSTWPWPDKLKRTLDILKDDHDATH